MADRFDVVAVRIEDEGSIVAWMVLRAKPRTAVVAPTRRHGRLMEGVYGSTVFAGERDVDGSAHFTSPDPEIRLSRLSEAHTGDVVLHDQLVAEWGESFLIEALALFKLRYRKANVIQHRSPPALYQNQPTSVRYSILTPRSSTTANIRERFTSNMVSCPETTDHHDQSSEDANIPLKQAL
jgi:hypothetical protein